MTVAVNKSYSWYDRSDMERPLSPRKLREGNPSRITPEQEFGLQTVRQRSELRKTLRAMGVVLVALSPNEVADSEPSKEHFWSQSEQATNNQPQPRPAALDNLVEELTDRQFTTDSNLAPESAPLPPERPIADEVERIKQHWNGLVRQSYEQDERASSTRLLLSEFSVAEEPELFALAEAGEIVSTADVIRYFATKPVVGVDHMTRAEYVANPAIMLFDQTIPHVVQDELRRLMPGLCAQESKFNNNAKSPAGAEGIFQFMPATWVEVAAIFEKRFDREPSRLSLSDQVAMAGIHFSNIYKRLQFYSKQHGDVLDAIANEYFDSPETFERELLPRLMLVSYNTGSKRLMAVVVAAYKQLAADETLKATIIKASRAEPEVLFAYMMSIGEQSDDGLLAGFGTHGSQYLAHIIARLNILTSERDTISYNQ